MKRIVAVLLASLLAGTPAFAYGVKPAPKLLKSVAAIHVTVKEDPVKQGNICSAGVINAKKDLWLTAAHCVADMDSGELMDAKYDFDIEGKKMDVVFYDVSKDVAIVRATTDRPGLKFRPYPTLPGEDVQVAGFPFGVKSPWYVRGAVIIPSTRDIEPTQAYQIFDIAVAPGFSGSVIVDRDERVVSVTQIGFIGPFGGFSNVSGGATYDTLLQLQKYFAD